MSFVPLLSLTSSHHHSHKPAVSSGNASNHHSAIKYDHHICDKCPGNKKGINKVLGKVKGKRIFIWAQSPGKTENKEEMELVGDAGKFLWKELKRVGIKRKHCDIQNVMRCWPVNVQENMYPRFKQRNPNKEELKCCSAYNEQALKKAHPKLYLVFGQIAGKAILKKEFNPQSKRVFFSEHLKAWVVYLDHPAYFIYLGYSADTDREPNAALTRFREDLKKAKQLLKKHGSFDKYGYIKKQKYIGVTNTKLAKEAYQYLKEKGENGTRLVVDFESGRVNKHSKPDDNGKEVDLCVGFCAEKGVSYVFATNHPDAPISRRCRRLNRRLIIKLLKNKKIKKSAHYAVADVTMSERLINTNIENLDYDTLLGEYFRDPDAKAYGLAKIVERRYSNFLGYKDIRWPDAYTEEYRKKLEGKKVTSEQAGETAETTGKMNLARLPWKKMVLYNGGDDDVEKRIELSTEKYVNMPLMGVYLDASFILAQMERDPECQPLFDYDWNKKLDKIVVPRLKKLKYKIVKLGGKYAYIPKRVNGKIDWKYGERHKLRFNPNSNDHLNWLIYDKLKVPIGKDGRNVRKGTINRLESKYKKVRIVSLYNGERKVKTTYLVGYKKCADLNDGHLRTNWKLTGTGTGRLSSGKSKDKRNLKVINLQNVHGDPLIKCQIISDKRWRKLYRYWRKRATITKRIVKNKEGKERTIYEAKPVFNKHNWRQFRNFVVQLGFDFSQNELREVAEQSLDKALCRMFASKKLWKCHESNGGCGKWHKPDPHVEVGHALTGWAREVIAHDERVRRVIKNMQFGVVFGLQGEGLYQYVLALGAQTTRDEVEKFHKAYFRKFSRVKWLQEHYREMAERLGYVVNPYGFRRNMNVEEQKKAEEEGEDREGGWWGNKAINTPIQSAAHHFLTMALAVLKRKPKKYKKLKRTQLEVHDALYCAVLLKYLLKAAKLGYKLMVDEPMRISEEEFGIKKKVPLATKAKAGFRFGVHIEGIGEEGLNTEWDFLNAWCIANYELEKSYYKQLESK